MELVTLIGYFAAICTTFAHVPQAIKTIRMKETRDISLVMYIVLTVGLLAWLAYGIMLGEWPLIIANAITFCFIVTILCLKLRYG